MQAPWSPAMLTGQRRDYDGNSMINQKKNKESPENQPVSSQNDRLKWLHLDDTIDFKPGIGNIIKTHKFIIISLSIFGFGLIKGRVYNDHSYNLLIVFATLLLLIPGTVECYYSRFTIARLFSFIVIGFLLLSAASWVLTSRGGIFPLW